MKVLFFNPANYLEIGIPQGIAILRAIWKAVMKKAFGWVIFLFVILGLFPIVNAESPWFISFSGLEVNNQGSAAWNANGTEPEPSKIGHAIPAPYNSCFVNGNPISGLEAYYISSRDYDGIELIATGALQFINPVEGFPDLTTALTNNGISIYNASP